MTPERAKEIFDEIWNRGGTAINIILAACAEERKAALTEAVLHVEDTTKMGDLSHDQVIAIKGIVLRLLAFRDRA